MLLRPSNLVHSLNLYRSPTRRWLNTNQLDSLIRLLLRSTEISHPDAVRELRWIQEHASSSISTVTTSLLMDQRIRIDSLIRRCCERRANGEPLQYILGT